MIGLKEFYRKIFKWILNSIPFIFIYELQSNHRCKVQFKDISTCLNLNCVSKLSYKSYKYKTFSQKEMRFIKCVIL